ATEHARHTTKPLPRRERKRVCERRDGVKVLLSERMGCCSPVSDRSFQMAEMSPLRRRMIEDMTIRNLSPATQQSYLYAVSKFSRYFGHSPDRLGVEDVRAYLVHLASKGFAWSSLNQTVCTLRFFYGVTLGQTTILERIPFAREPRKLPTVLSADEVVRFLEAVASLKARVALTTAYAAGLRVSEVAALKVRDIDSRRMVVRIERGKGGKERYAMLSETLLVILRNYWRLAHPASFLFPGRWADKAIEPAVLHAACRSATAAAGLDKHVSVHVLLNWTPFVGPRVVELRCNLACPCLSRIKPLLAASASAVGMWATRLRCPSEAAYPQPSPPPRFCPCRRAKPPSASGCSSPGEG